MSENNQKPVMITGATGYVAGWVVRRFLEEGYTVHAPIRNPDHKEKTKYLDEMAAQLPGNIKYFKADLLNPGSYKESMEGCSLVLHTASPFTTGTDNPKEDLVDPALKGTRNVLESVNETESVERVVLTSSCAAIYGDNIDLQNIENQTLTEKNWNETSSLDHQPYSYSKTVAEREAWKIAGAQKRWKLVTINPSLVMGPGINPEATSESFNIMKQMIDGTMRMGAPELYIGMVDVRDVGEAHFRAATYKNAEGRYITSAHNSGILELAESLRENYGDKYPLPKRHLPNWLVILMGPLSGFKRKMLRRNLGYPWKADHSKIKSELNMRFLPMKKTMEDFLQQMEKHHDDIG